MNMVHPTLSSQQQAPRSRRASTSGSRWTRTRTMLTILSFLGLSLLLVGRCQGAAVVVPAAAAVTKPTHTDTGSGPIQLFVKTVKDARRHLAAAAVARSSSIFIMYPVDTIKTRMQMGQANPLRLAGIFKGVAGSLVGQVPYGVLTFGSYEIYKESLANRFPNMKPVFVYALSAVLGDLTGSGWLCPSEVVKQQMQAGMYSSTRQAISSIWKKKGLVGLYEGYFGGVARDVPFRVSQLVSFEVTKNIALKIKAQRMNKSSSSSSDEEMKLSGVEAAICGAVAGTFSAAITSPLDRIKTLLMTDSQAYGGSVFSCAAKIWSQEGFKGFTQGLAPRVGYIAPSVVIFFTVYELTQQRLAHWGTTTE